MYAATLASFGQPVPLRSTHGPKVAVTDRADPVDRFRGDELFVRESERVDVDALLGHLRREVRWFSEAAHDARIELPVPTCPEFDVADLIWHVTVVHHFWTAVVAGQLHAPDQVVQPERPPDARLSSHYDRTSAQLVATMSAADPAAVVWTPAPPHDVHFALRRVTHETTVHRCDVELAVSGAPRDIDAELAEDGIDEWVTVFLESVPDTRIDLVVEGSDRSWSLGDGTTAEAVVHGTGPALLLALWRRLPIERLRIDGNEALVVDFFEQAVLLA
jgi:uncharacterized protein (TIGR03083 family)